MKRGGQLTLSLGGTMRLVPASRSPLAVPAATGQPDAEGPMEQAAKRAKLTREVEIQSCRCLLRSRRRWRRAPPLRDSFIAVCARFIRGEGPIKLLHVLLEFDS